LCLTFNGEIYNYIELRDELVSEGVTFRSQSDTEVVLRAYQTWGTACFSRFHGFWALAIYDSIQDRVIVSRDRLGKKPLYWAKDGSSIYFASEIKALLQIPAIASQARPDSKAIWLWCSERLRDIDNGTFFTNIKSLPAGSWAEVNDTFPNNAKRYWRYPTDRMRESDISVTEACSALRETLFDAVRIRLRADVPVAVSLSGGMDSSAIVAIASQVSSQKLTTFTIKYDDPRYNEEPFARAVAERCGVDYRVMEPPTQDFWNGALAYTYLQEEPYHSPHQQTGIGISAAMRAEGIKVCLHGAAGDELFAGYPMYFQFAQKDAWTQRNFARFFSNAYNWTESKTSPPRRLLAAVAGQIGGGRIAALRDRQRSSRPQSPPLSASFLEETAEMRAPSPNTLSDKLYFDITNGLIPYWLRSGDKKDMAAPLEYRCPLLDHRVVELAMTMPENYLIRDGWHKWILRKAVEDLLPESIVWRRNKMGLPFPIGSFIKESDAAIKHIVDGSNNPYLDHGKAGQIEADWNLISFEIWYAMFFGDNIELIERASQLMGEKGVSQTGFSPEYIQTWANASIPGN
jgi:asparagine synthase (glutamine-hydrolysing)